MAERLIFELGAGRVDHGVICERQWGGSAVRRVDDALRGRIPVRPGCRGPDRDRRLDDARNAQLVQQGRDSAGLYSQSWFRNGAQAASALTGGGVANSQTGQGGMGDKSGGTSFTPTQIYQRSPLETIYAESWAARKVIDIPINDMFVRWRALQHPQPEALTAFEDAEKRHRVRSRLAKAMKAARLYGTGLIVIVTAEDDLESELLPDRLRPGDLRNLIVTSRFHAAVMEREQDIFSPRFGQPARYEISLGTGQKFTVHHSRVLRFDGMTAPDDDGWEWYDSYWGLPELIPVMATVFQDATISQSGAHMVQEFSIPVVKLQRFHEAIANESRFDPETPTASQIAESVSQAKSIYRTIFLDEKDDISRLAVNVSGLANLMERFAGRVAAAADIPATRFWGQSPVGMNATGDSDMANYSIKVSDMQATLLADPLERLDLLLARDAGIAEVPTYSWIPLMDLSETDQATILQTKVQAVSKAVEDGSDRSGGRPGSDRRGTGLRWDRSRCRGGRRVQRRQAGAGHGDAPGAAGSRQGSRQGSRRGPPETRGRHPRPSSAGSSPPYWPMRSACGMTSPGRSGASMTGSVGRPGRHSRKPVW